MDRPAILDRPFLKSGWRKRIVITGLFALLLGGLAVFFCFLGLWQDIQLRKAIAETDQMDPGWRIQVKGIISATAITNVAQERGVGPKTTGRTSVLGY
jgi:hypothetical protein